MKGIGWVVGGLAAMLAGCATGVGGGGGTPAAASERVCLSDYQIQSFSALDDEYLYIEGTGDRHYLFTMERGCFGLRGANTIGIEDRLGPICSNTMDRVIFRDMARGPTSCRILDIEEVADEEDARELVDVREEARRQN